MTKRARTSRTRADAEQHLAVQPARAASTAARSVGPGSSVLVLVRAVLPELAPAERRIATAVMDQPGVVAGQTITELAKSCATSATTVVRFCRAIGVRGYPELRLGLAAAVGEAARGRGLLTGDIDADDPLEQVVEKISHADAVAIEETAAQLDLDVVRAVVDAMATARRIDCYGVGASGFVALDLQQKLQRIGLPAFAWPDPHMALTSAALLAKGDLAIAMSHTGATIDTIDALEVAKRGGASTVALTNFPGSHLALVADLTLTTAARETTFRSGAMASRIAQLTVVDVLFVALAQRDHERTQAALEATFAALTSRRVRPSKRS
jgi:DNA-binding MurR/RpiR family transcriptional regulator